MHRQLLQKCVTNITELGKTPTILTPQTAQCNEVNMAMLTFTSAGGSCLDTLDTVVDCDSLAKIQNVCQKVKEDVTRTAGLEKTLNLCFGVFVH